MTKILVVDDSKTYNKTFCTYLKRPSYKILQAYTLHEAKHIVETNKDIDFIFLDLILPDGDGDDLIDVIDTNSKVNTKIIILTGTHDIQKRNYLFEKGVADYFIKDICECPNINNMKSKTQLLFTLFTK